MEDSQATMVNYYRRDDWEGLINSSIAIQTLPYESLWISEKVWHKESIKWINIHENYHYIM